MRQRTALRLLDARPRATRALAESLPLPRLIPRPSFFAHSYRTSHQYQPYQHQGYSHSPVPPPPPPDPFPFKRSRKARFARSIAWALLFGLLGVGATLSARIWYYLKKNRVKLDSKLDIRLTLLNNELLDKHNPAIQALKNDPDYQEIWPVATDLESITEEDGNIHHFVYTALRGFRGVFPRAFFNQKNAILVMVVDFGHGLDNDLGAVHNGILTAMVHESVELLAKIWFDPTTSYRLSDLFSTILASVYYGTTLSITVMPTVTAGNWCEVVAMNRALENPATDVKPFPDWLDPDDWNQRCNTFLCEVNTSERHPRDWDNQPIMRCIARFEIEGDDWPPPPPSNWPDMKRAT